MTVLPEEGTGEVTVAMSKENSGNPSPCTILPWASILGKGEIWIAGEKEHIVTMSENYYQGATGAIGGFYGSSLTNPIVIAPLFADIPFALPWHAYGGASYMRIWSCLGLSKSGYSLTIEVVAGGVKEAKANLKLDRWESGVPTELWKISNYDLFPPEMARDPHRVALIVSAGTVSIWVKHHEEPWGKIGEAKDSKYKSGFFGWEGQGESIFNPTGFAEGENSNPISLYQELIGTELPSMAVPTGMAMML